MPPVPAVVIAKLRRAGLLWQAEAPRFDLGAAPSVGGETGSVDYAWPLSSGLFRAGTVHEFFATAGAFNSVLTPASFSGLSVLLSEAVLQHWLHQKPVLKAALRQGEPFPGLLLWIGTGIWPTPFAIDLLNTTLRAAVFSEAAGATLDILPQCLFVRSVAADAAYNSLAVALCSAVTICAAAYLPRLTFLASKKLALTAQHSGACALILLPPRQLGRPSCATSRWLMEPASGDDDDCNGNGGTAAWQLTLQHCKGPQPSRRCWIFNENGCRAGRYAG